MSAKMKISGLKETFKALEQFEPKVIKALERKALRKAAKMLQAEAKQIVPVDEGELKDSIAVKSGKRSKKKISMLVETDTTHSGIVEYGGIHKEAEPYLRPAVDKNARAIVELFAKTLKEECDKKANA